MKVGDLVKDKEYPEPGLILEVGDDDTYRVLCPSGHMSWFSKSYIENDCELVSESR